VSKSSTVRHFEIVKLLRIVGEMSEQPPDLSKRVEYLVTETCKLVGARFGVFVVTDNVKRGRDPKHRLTIAGGSLEQPQIRAFDEYSKDEYAKDLSLLRLTEDNASFWCYSRRACVDDHNWYRSRFVDYYRRAAEVDDCIVSGWRMSPTTIVGFGWNRDKHDGQFSEREENIISLLNQSLDWLCRTAEQKTRVNQQERRHRLPPSIQSTLGLLLDKYSEREIAQLRGLSPHTIHDHIKQIYRIFNVHSRAELQAKLLRKKF